ncbi:MAG TPA: cytochrome b [Steroidobacteraceae bacterium]|jgi:cytochrome b561|nr:cytochrome b [Steroidobacteraceae bacterium]
MHLKNTLERYGAVAQLFHWAIVALIITQFVLALRAKGLSPVAKIGILATHKSVGITILGLALLRLAWRLFNPVPPLPPGTPRWQDRAAYVSHFLLYALLFITPLLGWLMSSARAFSVSWFGLVTLPDFIKPNKAAFETLHQAHEFMAYSLAAIAIVHAAAALKHHFLDRDDVLRRMLPVPGRRSHS